MASSSLADGIDHHDDPESIDSAAAGQAGWGMVAATVGSDRGVPDGRQLASTRRRVRVSGPRRTAATSGSGVDEGSLTIPAGQPWREPDYHVNGYPLPWRWQDPDGTVWDSEQLIEDNLGLAHKIACEFDRSGRTALPLREIEALCYLGLVRGCRKFNPRMPNPRVPGEFIKLSTRACPFIRGEVLHHVRDRGFLLRMPSPWKERWPRVRRLREDGLTPQQIESVTGVSEAEQNEMAAGMTGCHHMEEELHGALADAPTIREEDRLGPLLLLVDQAWQEMPESERRLLELFWMGPRRIAFPHGSLNQLLKAAALIRQGRRQAMRPSQLQLAVSVQEVMKDRPVRRRQPARQELEETAQQLGLML